MRSLLGALQWTLAIISVAGTVALFSWILVMILRKDRPNAKREPDRAKPQK